jgi:Ca2+-binding RTX toxin-like protein
MPAQNRSTRRRRAAAATVGLAAIAWLAATVAVSPSHANTSHAGWPRIDGMLLINKLDQSRPLVAIPGRDPFDGRDPAYRCDGLHKSQSCLSASADHTETGFVVKLSGRHNELLGGHGDDTLFAGPNGDVLWGDYKPSGQPTAQHDRIAGGSGNDFIYASHGTNDIAAGSGNDYIKAHYGHGTINCGGGRDVLYISRKAQRHYRIAGCETVSHTTLGY